MTQQDIREAGRARAASTLIAFSVMTFLSACGGESKPTVNAPVNPRNVSTVAVTGAAAASYAGIGFFSLDAPGATQSFYIVLTNVPVARIASTTPSTTDCSACWLLAITLPRSTRPAAGTYPLGDLVAGTAPTAGGLWILTSADGKSLAQIGASKRGSLVVTSSSATELRGSVSMVGVLLDPVTNVAGPEVTFTADFTAPCVTSLSTVAGVSCG